MPGPHRKPPPAEEVRKAWESDETLADIAARWNVSTATLRKWAKAIGLPNRQPGRPKHGGGIVLSGGEWQRNERGVQVWVPAAP